jgi:hypothetical protein
MLEGVRSSDSGIGHYSIVTKSYPDISSNTGLSLRITGFLDSVHHPGLKKLENTTLHKLDLFLFSGVEEDTYSVGWLRKS